MTDETREHCRIAVRLLDPSQELYQMAAWLLELDEQEQEQARASELGGVDFA